MIINGLKDLDHYILRGGDIVVFRVENEQGEFVDFKYVVDYNFLMVIQDVYDISPSATNRNDAIFTTLRLDPYEFCSKYYGYESKDGHWPFYKDYDYEAATNIVKALYTLIDTMNVYKSVKSWNPTIEDCKKQELEIINYTKELITKHKTVKTIKQDNNSKLKRV